MVNNIAGDLECPEQVPVRVGVGSLLLLLVARYVLEYFCGSLSDYLELVSVPTVIRMGMLLNLLPVSSLVLLESRDSCGIESKDLEEV